MAVEIRELVLRAHISERPDAEEKKEKEKNDDCNCEDTARQAVTEQVIEAFNRKKER